MSFCGMRGNPILDGKCPHCGEAHRAVVEDLVELRGFLCNANALITVIEGATTRGRPTALYMDADTTGLEGALRSALTVAGRLKLTAACAGKLEYYRDEYLPHLDIPQSYGLVSGRTPIVKKEDMEPPPNTPAPVLPAPRECTEKELNDLIKQLKPVVDATCEEEDDGAFKEPSRPDEHRPPTEYERDHPTRPGLHDCSEIPSCKCGE